MKTPPETKIFVPHAAAVVVDSVSADAGSSVSAGTPKLCDDVLEQIGQEGGSDLLWRLSQVNKSLQTRLRTPFPMRQALQADGYDSRDLPRANTPVGDAKLREMFQGERFFANCGRTLLQAPPPDLHINQYGARENTIVRRAGHRTGEEEWLDIFWAGQSNPAWQRLTGPEHSQFYSEPSADGRWLLSGTDWRKSPMVVHLFDLHASEPEAVLAAKFSVLPAFTPDAKALVGHRFTDRSCDFIRINLSGLCLQADVFSYSATPADNSLRATMFYSPQRKWALFGHGNSYRIVNTSATCEPLPKSLGFCESIIRGYGGFSKDESQAIVFQDVAAATIHPLLPPGPPQRIVFPPSVTRPPLAFGDDTFLCHVQQEGVEGLRLFSLQGKPLFSMVDHPLESEYSNKAIRGSRAMFTYVDQQTHHLQTKYIDFAGSSPRSISFPPGVYLRDPSRLLDSQWLFVPETDNVYTQISGQSQDPVRYFLQPQDESTLRSSIVLPELKDRIEFFHLAHGGRRILLSDNNSGVLVLPFPV